MNGGKDCACTLIDTDFGYSADHIWRKRTTHSPHAIFQRSVEWTFTLHLLFAVDLSNLCLGDLHGSFLIWDVAILGLGSLSHAGSGEEKQSGEFDSGLHVG